MWRRIGTSDFSPLASHFHSSLHRPAGAWFTRHRVADARAGDERTVGHRGGLGEPDIGHWFPPSDPSIEGISSLKILEKCAQIAAEKGMRIENVDSSLIAEAPRVKPHAAAMKQHIATALGIQPDQVGVKATTNERLGFVGRKEGIAAMAVACVSRK